MSEIECSKDSGWEIVCRLGEQLHGVFEAYYPNGRLARMTIFVNDKEHGVRKGFHSDGFLSVYKPYRNGIPVDTHKVWFKNKEMESLTIYDSLGQKKLVVSYLV